jgi:hypothetical protein
MFARVSNYQGPPNQVDEGIRTAREQGRPTIANGADTKQNEILLREV